MVQRRHRGSLRLPGLSLKCSRSHICCNLYTFFHNTGFLCIFSWMGSNPAGAFYQVISCGINMLNTSGCWQPVDKDKYRTKINPVCLQGLVWETTLNEAHVFICLLSWKICSSSRKSWSKIKYNLVHMLERINGNTRGKDPRPVWKPTWENIFETKRKPKQR